MILSYLKEGGLIVGMILMISQLAHCQSNRMWITYEPESSEIEVEHIVLISGDEEYRSEEGLPMLARILNTHHGFRTTVLFPIEPESGLIDPNYQHNVPGLQSLGTADLMVIATRFRGVPEDQMQFIDDYLQAGKPVIGLRTATHA